MHSSLKWWSFHPIPLFEQKKGVILWLFMTIWECEKKKPQILHLSPLKDDDLWFTDHSFYREKKSVKYSNANLKTLWLHCVTYVDGRALLYYAKTWLIALSYTYSTNICFAYVYVKWELGLRSEDFASKKGNSVKWDSFLVQNTVAQNLHIIQLWGPVYI